MWAILCAGGSGERFKQSHQDNKLLALLSGQTVLAHSARGLLSHQKILGLVVVAPKALWPQYQQIIEPLAGKKLVVWASGGATRRESVYHGLMALPEGVSLVAVHDAARPFVCAQWLLDATHQLNQTPELNGILPACPVSDTLKKINPATGQIQSTVDRTDLFSVQTPQLFRLAPLVKAHTQVPQALPVTDDAQLLELAYGPQAAVALLQAPPWQLKITLPTDLVRAEAHGPG